MSFDKCKHPHVDGDNHSMKTQNISIYVRVLCGQFSLSLSHNHQSTFYFLSLIINITYIFLNFIEMES